MSKPKEVVKVISCLPQPIKVSSAVPGTANLVMQQIPAFQDLVSEIQHWMEMSGDDGHTDSYFLPEDDLVYVDDGLVAVFEHVLDFDYQPRPAIPGVQSIVSKAHSANFKLALHEAVSTFSGSINVLVVGAGRGNDIRRCLNAYPSIDHFTLIEPSEARLDIAKNVCQEFGVPCLSLCGTFREVYCHVSDRKFDLIVMNMSFQHIAGDNRLYGDLSTNLSHQGVIIGTFFNHDLFFCESKTDLRSNRCHHFRLRHS